VTADPAESVRSNQERVLLLSMPFGALARPSLALGLLAAHCKRLGVECDVRYLTFPFATLVGPEEYVWLTDDVPYEALVGEWLFTGALYGERAGSDAGYVDEVLRGIWHLRADAIDRVLRMRAAVGPFLDACLDEIDWETYTLVGFTSMFQQNIASLALASRVKATHPQLTIAFGGANWEDPMGVALQRHFPFVDLVFSGEADLSFPFTLKARRLGRHAALRPSASAADLDTLPFPEFDPYFEQLQSSGCFVDIAPHLLVETARGCWWGERSHCTFCGLNGSTMAFRSKSPERVVDEIAYLRDRHGVQTIGVVDDILDMRYFKTLFPLLERACLDVELFWEVKANLSADHVRRLRAAGVLSIQPGIESLSDHVLALMRKGTTALKNVELLKWCREHGVTPLWNLLYGFPGETESDYEEMRELIQAIWHLEPPRTCCRIRLDRFSPYHAEPDAFGLTNVRPKAALRHLYPFDSEEVMAIAYYFDFDYVDGRRANAYAKRALEVARAWRADTDRGQLTVSSEEDRTVHLFDSRRGRAPADCQIQLDGWRAAVFLACDRSKSLRELMRLPDVVLHSVAESDVHSFLTDCVRDRLMVSNTRSWLNVAVHVPARAAPEPSLLTASGQSV
jgi:ribosomal peptide maturation radical SAM protein 1